MKIEVTIKFKGLKGYVERRSLIDTGAEVSMIPLELATSIGSRNTNQKVNTIGVHKQSKILPLGLVEIYFLSLNNVGGSFPVAITDVNDQEPIIGLDIMKPLGINIDTKTSQLTIKNEIWEAFKILAAAGVLIFAGVEILNSLVGEKN